MDDYKYFIDNLDALYKEYGHCFLVIKNQQVIGTYNRMDAAYDEARKTEPIGTFIIQECVDDPEKLVLSFQSNVAVA
ncbi:MAG: hypothetical protein LBU13_08400 [Synergistaceae bacterium]|nr:hypothetical protein [Synergistaceae bacterium]